MAAIAPRSEESFEIVGGRADAGLIVLCDHASNALPAGYGTLGLPAHEFQRHIAYDIGAAGITRVLAEAFRAPAILTRTSRLLIDPNRGPDDPTLIMRLSDGAIIPGNRHLDAAERERRTRLYYAPYHRAIEDTIERCLATGVAPAIVSIHSFTEAWKGVRRPWQVGILWDRDVRLARPLIEALAADSTLHVGDNQPYKGTLEGDCLWQHATARGLMNALVEVRQDLIAEHAGQVAWGQRLVAVLDGLHGLPDLHLGRPVPIRPSQQHSASTPLDARQVPRVTPPALERLETQP